MYFSNKGLFDFVEDWLHLTSLNNGCTRHSPSKLVSALVCTAIDVYRLEEDGSLLQEGGGGLPLGALRACLL